MQMVALNQSARPQHKMSIARHEIVELTLPFSFWSGNYTFTILVKIDIKNLHDPEAVVKT
jgi:hypothetical protein